MSTTQRYWLVFSPGLILMGFFFGIGGFLFFFVPSYFCYYAHRKEWSVGRAAIVALGIAFVLFILATSRRDYL